MPNLYSFILSMTVMYFGTMLLVRVFWGQQILDTIEEYIDYTVATMFSILWYFLWLLVLVMGRFFQLIYEINNYTQNLP